MTIIQQLTKADTEQTCARIIKVRITIIKDLIQFYLKDRRHTLRHTLRQNKLNDKNRGPFLQPGREGVEVAVLGT